MKLTEEAAPGGAIEGFRGRGFRVGGVDYPGGVIAGERGAVAWAAEAVTAMTPADLVAVPDAELLIIGTGATMARPPRPVLDAMAARSITVEFMDSRAAARTYNVLLAERRRVAVALLPL